MDIFIDGEWNGYGGQLISMALCAEDGREWYEVLQCEQPCPWVEENVMPILNKTPIAYSDFQESLKEFLGQFDSVTIIADWPEDIERFCAALITGPGERLDTPPLRMEIQRIDAGSEQPHNALADARGIRMTLRPFGGTPPTEEPQTVVPRLKQPIA